MDHEVFEGLMLLGLIIMIVGTPILITARVIRNAKNGKKLPKILD